MLWSALDEFHIVLHKERDVFLAIHRLEEKQSERWDYDHRDEEDDLKNAHPNCFAKDIGDDDHGDTCPGESKGDAHINEDEGDSPFP